MTARFSRQSFLGSTSESRLRELHVAIVGLGGGGSHIAQQLAHVGIGIFSFFDADKVEDSNLNRLVGATSKDVEEGTSKVEVASRLVRGISAIARVNSMESSWQEASVELRDCDVVIGAVDSFAERDQLERSARRYLQPYIDIGMDVHPCEGGFSITGQVALSLPGRACLHCMGVVRPDLLHQEAQRYGVAGGKPQVIWPNGVLASTAVGLLLSLVSPWHRASHESMLLEYDGNRGELRESAASQMLALVNCPHYAWAEDLGDPWFGRAALR
jgi:hypothetical protein